jgi:hypothetical protein
MAMDRWGVIKIKGMKPERFIIAGLDLNFPQGKPFMKTSVELSEEELRKELASRGMPRAEIESAIKKARENPW